MLHIARQKGERDLKRQTFHLPLFCIAQICLDGFSECCCQLPSKFLVACKIAPSLVLLTSPLLMQFLARVIIALPLPVPNRSQHYIMLQICAFPIYQQSHLLQISPRHLRNTRYLWSSGEAKRWIFQHEICHDPHLVEVSWQALKSSGAPVHLIAVGAAAVKQLP